MLCARPCLLLGASEGEGQHFRCILWGWMHGGEDPKPYLLSLVPSACGHFPAHRGNREQAQARNKQNLPDGIPEPALSLAGSGSLNLFLHLQNRDNSPHLAEFSEGSRR